MVGGTHNHDGLAIMFATLSNVFAMDKDLDYRVNGIDLKIRIEQFDKVVYADALVITEKQYITTTEKIQLPIQC